MKFFAHGKLLLTAEYAVLGGAKALAVPTKLGQSLDVKPTETSEIHWKSIDEKGDVWYENSFAKSTFSPNTQDTVGSRLQQLFTEIASENPTAWEASAGFSFVSTLDFNRQWGLGSSSTLISLLAQWANVNPYQLQQQVFGGSGYDVACATAKSALMYTRTHPTKPVVETADFSPSFKKLLFFVHLNQKQDSQKAVADFDYSLLTPSKIEEINTLTDDFTDVENIENLQKLMHAHEEIIGELIQETPVKKRLFPDYDGAIKSLGAWGGDFILTCGNSDTTEYFANKGYKTCIPYNELIFDGS